MILSMSGQAAIFLVTAAAGAVLGVLYDCFRILRRIWRHKTTATTIEDAIFWIMSTFLMFAFLVNRNFGEIRGFIFMGLALGAILYFLTLSRYFTKFALVVLRWLRRALLTIISPVAAISRFIKNRLKLGHRYVKMKRDKIYQRMKRRKHEGRAKSGAN